jgi:hypothetical protein
VDLLVDGEARLVVRLLAEAIEVAPDENRPLVVGALQRLVEPLPASSVHSEEAVQSLGRSLSARPLLPAEERADLWQVYARLTSGADARSPIPHDSRVLLERALGDRVAPVRLAAVAELHRRGTPPPGLPDLDQVLADALSASDALLRRAARKELRASLLAASPDEAWARRLQVLAGHLEKRADRAETAEALLEVARGHGSLTRSVAEEALRYADDRDPRVRAALLAFAGHAGLAEEAPRLVDRLGARNAEELAGAQEGLVALGSQAVLPLLAGFEAGGPAQREAILCVLSELEVGPATLEELRVRQLDTIYEAMLYRVALEGLDGPAPRLLRRRLDERAREGLGSLLHLLGAMRDQPHLAELEGRLRRAKGERERDVVVEAIESLLGRQDRELIVPLLEAKDARAGVGAATRALGRALPEVAEAIDALRQSSDMSCRQLASIVPTAPALEAESAIGDPEPMLSAIEIAARLQDTRGFDRLSTPQLMRVATVLQEQKVPEGDRIYRAGEEGSGLYLVLEGEVELRRGGLLLERVGSGGFFGELSALDGSPRSADAVARMPTTVLRLERDDLLSLLEEAPALTIGLSQALTDRVRRLIDRLDEADGQSEEAS